MDRLNCLPGSDIEPFPPKSDIAMDVMKLLFITFGVCSTFRRIAIEQEDFKRGTGADGRDASPWLLRDADLNWSALLSYDVNIDGFHLYPGASGGFERREMGLAPPFSLTRNSASGQTGTGYLPDFQCVGKGHVPSYFGNRQSASGGVLVPMGPLEEFD